MKVVNRHCAGLDVHKDQVVACVPSPEKPGPAKHGHNLHHGASRSLLLRVQSEVIASSVRVSR